MSCISYRADILSKREATNTAGSSGPVSAFVACFFRTYGFPLMAALMLMLMMLIVMRMLVGMFFCYMFMVVTIVRMGHFLVLMLVLMLILVMATHSVFTSFLSYT